MRYESCRIVDTEDEEEVTKISHLAEEATEEGSCDGCAPTQEYLPSKQMPCLPFGFGSERDAIFQVKPGSGTKVGAGVMKEEASLDLRSV